MDRRTMRAPFFQVRYEKSLGQAAADISYVIFKEEARERSCADVVDGQAKQSSNAKWT